MCLPRSLSTRSRSSSESCLSSYRCRAFGFSASRSQTSTKWSIDLDTATLSRRPSFTKAHPPTRANASTTSKIVHLFSRPCTESAVNT